MVAAKQDALAPDPEITMRRAPSQRRSRERVEHILSCASKLIAERGSDAMRMSEVAELSGISIGSLYQYFPDKAAIVRTLAERYNVTSRACIAEGLAAVKTPGGLDAAFSALIDEYYMIFLAEPVMRDVWSAMQADAALRDIELRESRQNAALLADALRRAYPDADSGRLQAAALLMMHLGECTMRLAVSVGGAEGRALVDAFKVMARRNFEANGNDAAPG